MEKLSTNNNQNNTTSIICSKRTNFSLSYLICSLDFQTRWFANEVLGKEFYIIFNCCSFTADRGKHQHLSKYEKKFERRNLRKKYSMIEEISQQRSREMLTEPAKKGNQRSKITHNLRRASLRRPFRETKQPARWRGSNKYGLCWRSKEFRGLLGQQQPHER